MRHGFRRLVLGLLTGAGAMGMSLVTAVGPAFADDVALIMGGTGTPLPSASWIDSIGGLYLQPNYSTYIPQALYTPEELYPATGLSSLTLNASVNQGVGLLDNAIRQLVGDENLDGNRIVVFGDSQSAIIASLEMEQLVSAGETDLPLQFILVGNEIAPNGGLISRFSGLDLPWLGMIFHDATLDNAFPTEMYSIEYDGFVDFPRYPINILSDLNAIMGIFLLHGNYGTLTPDQIAGAIQLATEGPTQTTYYMIPTETLPLLEPLRLIPVLGKPLVDLLQPALRVLVNLGYGDPDYGYSTDPANIPTGFGIFPDIDPGTVVNEFMAGVKQGFADSGAEISSMVSTALSEVPDISAMEPLAALQVLIDGLKASVGSAVGSFTDVLNSVSTAVGNAPDVLETVISVVSNFIGNLPGPSITDLTDGLGSAIAAQGEVLSALTNLVLSLAVSIPTYDINLFTANLEQGDLLGAIGDPLAANVGLLSVASMFAVGAVGLGVQSAIQGLQSSVDGLFDFAP